MPPRLPKYSAAQLSIAQMYHIPQAQAHTISVEKFSAYLRHLRTSESRLERFLDGLESVRRSVKERELF